MSSWLQSKLTIMGDKGIGVLGESDLNLSDYAENEYKLFKIPLKKCNDQEAYIEVGLRATPSKGAPSTPRSTKGGHATESSKD